MAAKSAQVHSDLRTREGTNTNFESLNRRALNELDNEALHDATPAVLQRLIARTREKLGHEPEEG